METFAASMCRKHWIDEEGTGRMGMVIEEQKEPEQTEKWWGCLAESPEEDLLM